ncbi:MAG TPA: hypothetical protein VIT65_22250 [Microlunatus sp.]
MYLDLVDPFAEVVVFGKAYPVAWPPSSAKSVKALVPTGRHVSHANALHHTRNSGGGGGKATRLERYTGKKSGGKATSLLHVSKLEPGPRRRNTSPHSAIPTASKSGRRLG